MTANTGKGTRLSPVPAPRPEAGAGLVPLAAAPPATRSRALLRKHAISGLLFTGDVAAFAGAVALTAALSLRTVGLLVLLLVLFATAGLYRRRLSLSVLDDAPVILGRALAGGAAAMVVAGLDDGSAGIARLVTSVLFGALALSVRAVAYAAIRARRRQHHLRRRTLVLGAGAMAGNLARTLLEHPEYGLHPVGMLDDEPLLTPDERPVPLLGGYAQLGRVLVERGVGVVVVTFGSAREPAVVSMLRACDRLACEIYFVPRLYELHSVTKETEVIWGIPLLRLRRAPFRSGTWGGKRITDVVLASAAMVVLAPVLLVCGLISRLETGSVLFRQTRIGLDGAAFTLYKFCSMRPAVESEATTRWNIGEDDRVRLGGRLLRRTSLDELPQLWNVVRGDMSLVGPRPERPFFVDEFTRQYPFYTARHRVPVGLTGWAQIHGLRGDTSIGDRARFDNFYIENWSLWGDAKILLRTFGQVLKAAGR